MLKRLAIGIIASVMCAAAACASPANTVYRLSGAPGDGSYPAAELLNVGGTLYGTATRGGNGPNCPATHGCGMIFSVTPGGVEMQIYSFQGGADGSYPASGLIYSGGTLYGTTAMGGTNGLGTVFGVTTGGIETVLYSFQGGASDGANPYSALINVGGTLYGTTSRGGANNLGTIFQVSLAGAEMPLYSFQGGNDGAYPEAALLKMGSMLYGTASSGGAGGVGTVFKTTLAGAEFTVYPFLGGLDGATPVSALINVGGTLYGTTEGGGAGFGTVFGVTNLGAETLLYPFQGGTDGEDPLAGLLDVGGVLYGTTASGGGPTSQGTVFSITQGGVHLVLNSFQGGHHHGDLPRGSLIKVGPKLYGTTASGGFNPGVCSQYGCGLIYKIAP